MPAQGPSRRIFRIVLWSLIVLVVIDTVVLIRWMTREPAGSLPEKRTRMVARHELFAQLPPDSGAIIFLGDSHTEGFPLDEMFPGLPVVNRGVGNSTSEDLLERALMSCGKHPRMILLQAGVNDLFQGRSLDRYSATMRQLVDTIQHAHPGTPIVVQAIMPTRDAGMDDDVRRYNAALAELAREKHLPFLDLYASFAQGDLIDPRYTYDGLHLSAAGYQHWADLLMPLLGSRSPAPL